MKQRGSRRRTRLAASCAMLTTLGSLALVAWILRAQRDEEYWCAQQTFWNLLRVDMRESDLLWHLRNGANVNTQFYNDRRTALMAAAEIDDLRLARLLVKYGARPDMRDSHGRTARTIARQHGSRNVYTYLTALKAP